MKKLNLYWYKDFLPQGLLTLLYKKRNISLQEFIELTEDYMSEEEKTFLFKKIHKEEGMDLSKFRTEKKDVPLFKSVSSENESSGSKNVTVVFSAVEEKEKKEGVPDDNEVRESKPNVENAPEKTKENKRNDISLKVTEFGSKNF